MRINATVCPRKVIRNDIVMGRKYGRIPVRIGSAEGANIACAIPGGRR